jgi:mono/diheme cytochrome c family protein
MTNMTKASTVVTALFILVIVVVIAAGVSFFRGGVSSRGTPSAMESMAAREIRHMAIPAEARKQQNPVARSSEAIHDGMLHFADHCAICHDNDGGGETMIGGGLYPKPPDLRKEQTQKLSDGEIFWIIENGVRFTGMPAFGGQHGSQEDSWKLVHFIRHLPQLTPEESMEMERNNPKGPEDREEEGQEQEFLKGGAVQQKRGPGHHR